MPRLEETPASSVALRVNVTLSVVGMSSNMATPRSLVVSWLLGGVGAGAPAMARRVLAGRPSA